MSIASPFLVSFMLLDLLRPTVAALPPVPDTAYAATGVGELTVTVDRAESMGSVPRGATRVPFLSLNISASCESSITVDAIELRHAGLGKSDDIAGVYAVDAFTRVTRMAHFDARSARATLRFRSFTLPKCGAASLQIFADMTSDATVASEHAISLANVSGILSSAKQTHLVSQDVSANIIAAPTDAGILTVRMLPVSKTVRYGRIETVARLQLTADARSGHLLKRITLTNKGDARDMNLQWLSLETLSATRLTPSVPRMRSYSVTLEFHPTYILHRAETVVLILKAEIHGSQSKKIDFTIEEPSDIVALPYRDR